MTPLDQNSTKSRTTPSTSTPANAADAAPPGLSAPPGVAALWHAISRRWLTILVLGGALGSLAAVVAWYLVPAKFSTVAMLHFDQHPPRGLDETREDYLSNKLNQATAVKADPVLVATLAKPEVAELPEVRAQGKDGLLWMKTAVLVDDKTSGPETIRLTVNGDRAEDVAILANAWAQTAGELYTAHEESRVKDRIRQLRQNYRDNTELLRKKKNELQARRDLLGLEDPKVIDAKALAEQASQTALQTQRVQVELELKKLSLRSADLRTALSAPDKVEISPIAIDEEIDKDFPQDPLVKAQIDQLLLLQKKLGDRVSALPAEDRENDTGVVQYRQAISQIEKGLAAEREQLRPDYEKRLRGRLVERMKDEAKRADQEMQGLKGQQETLETKVKEGEGRIAALRAGGQAAGKSNPEVEGMQAEVNEMELGVKRLSEEEANLEASLPLSPRLTVMEAAAVPRSPNLDKLVKAAGGAFLALFGLVFFGVAVIEFRSRRVYKADDVSQGLGLPLLGTVPSLPVHSRAAAPVAEDAALGPMIESVDGIRTMLLHAGRFETLRVIMVASAVSGEGKTSLASHLAASLARGGRRTLLVDGDLRNPGAHQQFGLTAGPGLSELLRGEMEPTQVVQNTPLENLSLLAAGAADRRALQALAQEGILRNVFDELKENYDFLIVDVSPVLPVADALLIGEHADAVVMSVLRNVSRLPAVHAAQQRLASLGIRVLGAVVIGEGMEMYGNVRYPSVPAMAAAKK